jgi:hypothetical protein
MVEISQGFISRAKSFQNLILFLALLLVQNYRDGFKDWDGSKTSSSPFGTRNRN